MSLSKTSRAELFLFYHSRQSYIWWSVVQVRDQIVYTLPSDCQEKLLTLTNLVRIKCNEEHHLFAIGDCLESVVHGSDAGIHQWCSMPYYKA